MALAALICIVPAGAALAQGNAEGQAWMMALEQAEVRELSETEMKNLLAAMEDLEAMESDAIDTDTPTMFDAIASNAEAKAILSRHDFQPAGFQSAVYNVVLAMGALAMEGQQAEIDQAMAQLEAMKGQLPEAQYEMMEKQVMGTVALFRRAPEPNIRLVEKYQAELEALGE